MKTRTTAAGTRRTKKRAAVAFDVVAMENAAAALGWDLAAWARAAGIQLVRARRFVNGTVQTPETAKKLADAIDTGKAAGLGESLRGFVVGGGAS